LFFDFVRGKILISWLALLRKNLTRFVLLSFEKSTFLVGGRQTFFL